MVSVCRKNDCGLSSQTSVIDKKWGFDRFKSSKIKGITSKKPTTRFLRAGFFWLSFIILSRDHWAL